MSESRLGVLFVAATLLVSASGTAGSEPTTGLDNEASQGINPNDHQRDLTANSDFRDLCVVFATGYSKDSSSGSLRPTFGHNTGTCGGKRKPFVLSVTHESPQNNHIGAANYRSDIGSYMADFDYAQDLGHWITLTLSAPDSTPVVLLGLDTVSFKKTNVTGWPLQYGHLFLGFGDSSFDGTVANPAYVEFDIRIRREEVRKDLYAGYSGQRVVVGVEASWKEAAPRINTVHFMEIDLVQADGYTESYGDPERPLCKDATYDRCYYDPQGRYSEGREVRLSQELRVPSPPAKSDDWTHVKIPLSAIFRSLHWVSPPTDWSTAKLTGLYFAIESEGATRTLVELRRYRSYVEQ
jgi:hypothetical protein